MDNGNYRALRDCHMLRGNHRGRIADKSIISLSSLCAPEHFGLGRYGDPVDPEACFMALRSMQRVLAPGGHLYIAVPVGDVSGVAFNAHRIFAPELVAETLNELQLEDFSVIKGCEYIPRVSFDEFHSMGLGINYGANVDGLFEFARLNMSHDGRSHL